ncbi:polysaccharide pyruvyl transferase family protein [Aliihoeflea sp. PC F10.4]
MKLTYFQSDPSNFGDELNSYMWQRLLPADFLDDDESELFLGIGSILLDYHPKEPRKYVLGSGYARYTPLPDIHDGSWDVIFVRGPRTAAELGLPPEKSISDAAVLLHGMETPEPAPEIDVAFMPHYESLERGHWQEACRLAGIPLIDPRDDVEKILAQIRGTKMLITEAMHGAIVADALRTPWVAVQPLNAVHHHKWSDWAESLDIDLRHHQMLPSSALEVYTVWTKGRGEMTGRAGRMSKSALARPANRALTHLAASRLQKIATREPQLSRDDAIANAAERAMTCVDQFVRERTLQRPESATR